MSRLTWAGIGFVVVAGVALPRAQAPADFTGVWQSVKEAPAKLPAAPSAVFGGRFELRHAGGRLTVLRPVRDFSVATEFPLDGSEVRTRVPGGQCMGDSGTVATASIAAGAITYRLVGSLPSDGGPPNPLSITYVFRMTSADTLEVESSMRAANGEPQQVASVYRRTNETMPPTPSAPNVTVAPATIKDVAWIAGTWAGGTAPTSLEERWTPAAGGTMLGTSRTLRGGSMSEFEFLCITQRAGGLVYTAMPNGRAPATDFLLTAIDAHSATFENPSHNFPKKIRYARRPDGGMEATISGDNNRSTTFVFQKQQ